MARVNALVITGYGTNCEQETAHAVHLAGADKADVVFFSDLLAGRTQLKDYNFLLCPGGFLDGDDLGAAQAAALRWKHARTASGEPVVDQLKQFFEAGASCSASATGSSSWSSWGCSRPWAGLISNARFPVLQRLRPIRGPLGPPQGQPGLALRVPERHRPAAPAHPPRRRQDHPPGRGAPGILQKENLIAFQYADPETGQPTQEYPANPNGSPLAIAGLTDPSGRVLGLMPHPEAFNHRYQPSRLDPRRRVQAGPGRAGKRSCATCGLYKECRAPSPSPRTPKTFPCPWRP